MEVVANSGFALFFSGQHRIQGVVTVVADGFVMSSASELEKRFFVRSASLNASLQILGQCFPDWFADHPRVVVVFNDNSKGIAKSAALSVRVS